MIGRLVLGAFEVVHRVMKKGVVPFNAAVSVIEARDADRLLAWVLRRLGTDHVNLASHFNRVVKRVNRISTMVLASVSLQFPLVNAVARHV